MIWPRLMTVRGILSEVTRLEKDVCRDANEDEIIQIIKREGGRRDESLEFARAALDLGFYISFSGIVTFRNAVSLQQIVPQVLLVIDRVNRH